MGKTNYEKLGASASKAGLHKALDKAGFSHGEGLFASVIPDIAGDPNYLSFLHCDGAGTKSIVAYLLYKETGDANAFYGLAQDALVMNLDDIFCIGLPENLFLANAIARNAHLIPDDAIAAIVSCYQDLCAKLKEQDIQIELTGGETADCGDVVRTLLIDAVVGGRIKKEYLINANNIVPGDVIIGLSSLGKTTYEDKENSGVASNGLTLARHSLLSSEYAQKFSEIVDESIDKDICYGGPFKLSDTPEGLGMSIGEALLSPTRTDAPILAKIFQNIGSSNIHGVIHQTGGGMSKVLRFGKGNRYIKNNLFDTPPLFSLIQEHGEVSWEEMYQVCNMGHRMEVYLPAEFAEEVIKITQNFGIQAKQIGHVEKADEQNIVVVDSEKGSFSYNL